MNIAEERIDRLHALAREAASDRDHDRAREYVRLARRVVLSIKNQIARGHQRGVSGRNSGRSRILKESTLRSLLRAAPRLVPPIAEHRAL